MFVTDKENILFANSSPLEFQQSWQISSLPSFCSFSCQTLRNKIVTCLLYTAALSKNSRAQEQQSN